jgi:hypothetical protein
MKKEERIGKNNSGFTTHSHEHGEHDSEHHHWKDISELRTVKRDGVDVHAHVCKHHVHELEVHHHGLHKLLTYGKDEQAYQAMRARVTLSRKGKEEVEVGRIIGKIRDNVIREEYLLDGIKGEIVPLKVDK